MTSSLPPPPPPPPQHRSSSGNPVAVKQTPLLQSQSSPYTMPHRSASSGSTARLPPSSPSPGFPPPPPPSTVPPQSKAVGAASSSAAAAPLSPTSQLHQPPAASPSLLDHVSRLEAELDHSVMSFGELEDEEDHERQHQHEHEAPLNDDGIREENEIVMGDGNAVPAASFSDGTGGLRRRAAAAKQRHQGRAASDASLRRRRQQRRYQKSESRRSGAARSSSSRMSDRGDDPYCDDTASETSSATSLGRKSRRSRRSGRSRSSRRYRSPSSSPSVSSRSPSPRRRGGIVGSHISSVQLTIFVAFCAAVMGCFGGFLVSHRRQTDAIVHTFAAIEHMKIMEEANGDGADRAAGQGERSRGGSSSRSDIKKEAEEKAAAAAATNSAEDEKLDEEQRKMREYIKSLDKKAVIERFGKGPHRVMFSIDFPQRRSEARNGVKKDPRQRFFVETAPLESMPHSILAFLDMVDKGLFDGMEFNRITDHDGQWRLMKGVWSDLENRLRPAEENVVNQLREAGRWPNAVSHPEHSRDALPHGMYTVGFVDGMKPGLFISTSEQNSELRKEGVASTSSAFGRVVGGGDTVNRLMEGGSGTLSDPAVIKFARFVGSP